ncbi:MAG TPA: YbhN family protein [Streptosporangiaceae bacterium]
MHPGSGQISRNASPRLTPRFLALIVLAVVVVAGGILLARHTLAESLTALTQLDWSWCLAAVGFEAASLATFALSRRRLLCADGHRAGFGSVMAVTCAGNALQLTIPVAGTQVAMVYSYREFRRRGLDSALTGWALAVSAILSTAALALILLAGAITGGVSAVSAAGLAGAAVFLVPATSVLLALRYQRVRCTLDRLLARVIAVSHRVFRWPAEDAAGALENLLDRVSRIRLSWPRYTEVFILSMLNWVADCGCLASMIRATGSPVPWHGLLLAYAAGVAIASTGFTPGGFALVEAALTAALVASGLTAPSALASVLAYRLLSFWAVMIGGWILMIALTRARTAHGPVYVHAGRPPRAVGVAAARVAQVSGAASAAAAARVAQVSSAASAAAGVKVSRPRGAVPDS